MAFDLGVGLTALVFFLLALNVLAAGFVTMAHIWRRGWSHQRRVSCAALAAGTTPFAVLGGVLLPEFGAPDSEFLALSIGLAAIVAISAAVSLPLALVISRKLGVVIAIGDTFS